MGNHTFWVIVDLDTKVALTPESDRRRVLQFNTEAAANAYRARYEGNFIVVRIPG